MVRGPEQNKNIPIGPTENSDSPEIPLDKSRLEDISSKKVDDLSSGFEFSEASDDELTKLALAFNESDDNSIAEESVESQYDRKFSIAQEASSAAKKAGGLDTPKGKEAAKEVFRDSKAKTTDKLRKAAVSRAFPPEQQPSDPQERETYDKQKERVEDMLSGEHFLENAQEVLAIERETNGAKRAAKKEAYIAKLTTGENALTKRQAEEVYNTLARSGDTVKQLAEIEKDEAIFDASPERFDEYVQLKEEGDPKKLEKFVKEIDKDGKLQEKLDSLAQTEKLVDDVTKLQKVRDAREEDKKRQKQLSEEIDGLDEGGDMQQEMDQLGVGNVYAQLPPEGQQAVDQLMDGAGDGLVVSTFLSGANIGETVADNIVAGAEVVLDYATGVLQLIGHHEADTALAGPQPIDPPTVQEFNNVYQNSIARQNANNILLSNEQFADSLFRMVGNFDPEGSTLVNEDQANRYHNWQDILLGAGRETAEEGTLFKTLGVMTASGAPNLSRMFKLGQAMRLYIDDSLDEYKHHGETFIGSEELITLTKIWDEETEFTLSSPKTFPPPGELIALTQERLSYEQQKA